MPFLYVYSPDDFVGGLPSETGTMASGSDGWTLKMKPDADPTLIEVSDSDLVFDELDSQQSLANLVEIDGDTYGANTAVHTAYDLLNSSNGYKVTSIHFGGNGYQQGAVDSLISTKPLMPNESYCFDQERTSHQKVNAYDDYVACFTMGSRIASPSGLRSVETLSAGDIISTLDHGPQPLRRVGKRRVLALGGYAPVHFAKGAIGNKRPLEVSPQHRMFLTGPHVEMYFGFTEALALAKAFVDGAAVTRRLGGWVTYFHLLLDRHEIVSVEGVASESLLLTPPNFSTFGDPAAAEVGKLFGFRVGRMESARPCLRVSEARCIAPWAILELPQETPYRLLEASTIFGEASKASTS